MEGRTQHISALEKGNNATLEVGRTLETELTRIAELAKRRPRIKLQTLIHAIDEESLKTAHSTLRVKGTGALTHFLIMVKYGICDIWRWVYAKICPYKK